MFSFESLISGIIRPKTLVEMMIKSIETDYKIKADKFKIFFDGKSHELYMLADGQKIMMKDGDKIIGLIEKYSKGKMKGKELDFASLDVENGKYIFTTYYIENGEKKSESKIL